MSALRIVRLLIVTLATLVTMSPGVQASPRVSVSIQRNGDVFDIDAVLLAPVPLDVAWEVLTDFESMEKFVPNVQASRIVARDGNRLTIEQNGVARFGPLRFSFASERIVELTPRTLIRSTQTRGNMTRLESLTRFSPTPDGTRLDYHVDVEPDTMFPAALTQRFLVHEIEEQFEAIVREMVRRLEARRPPR